MVSTQFPTRALNLNYSQAVRGVSGLGEGSVWNQIGAGVTSGATVGTSTAINTGSAVAGAVAGGLVAAAPFTGPAAPFLLAAASMVAPIASLFKGCGATCTQATQYANQASDALTNLLNLYMSQPVHYRSAQQATLQHMDDVFSMLQRACGNPALGPAGQRCISERLVMGGTAPWCPTPDHTGCDWITAFRMPVANDPDVVADPEPESAANTLTNTAASVNDAVAGTVEGQLKNLGVSDATAKVIGKWALPAAAVLILIGLVGGKD